MYNKKLLSKIDLGKSTKTNPYKKDIIYDPMGQWKYPGQPTRIPSSNITMKGVNYPVLAVTDNGQKKMMQPGKDYKFPGAKYVDEFPQAKKGGSLNSKKYTRSLDGIGSLFRESALFKKPKSSKKKLFHPKAKYYQDGGNTEGMTAMMKARLAYANQFGNPAAERMINLPDESYEFTGEEPNAGVPAGNIGTHFMGSVDNYAVPWIQQGPDGLFYNQNAGPEDLEAIRFDSDEDANYFAEHYKEVSPGFLNQKQNGGPFDQFTGDEPDPLDPHQVFLKNWYENRVFPKELEKARPTILSQFNQSFPPYVVTDKLPADALAAYNNMNNTVELNQNYPKDIQESSKTHELNHWATDTADEFLNEPHGYLIEDNIINPKNINTGSPESDTYTKDNFEYLVSPREVHSRIMTFRELAGFKPNQVITEKDVEDYFNKAGDTLDPDIKDLKNVTKGNKAMVELLNGMALNNTPISENNIQYTKKGGALNKFVEGGEPCDEGFKWNERTKRCEPLYYRPEFADPKKGLYAKFPKATPATIEDLNSYLPWAPFRNEEFDNYRLIGYNWNPDENNGLYPFREPPKGQIVYNRDTKEMVFQSDMGNKTYGEPTPLTEEQFNFWGQSEPAFQYPKNYGNVKDKNAPEKRLFYDPNSGHWYNANDHYKKGGALLTKKVTCKKCGWTWDAADGGNDMTTCHKCGGQGLIHAKKGGAYYDDSRNAWVEADGTVGPNGPSTYANGGALRQFVDGGNPCTDGQMWDEATQSCVSANETTTEEVGFDPIDMWAQDYEEKNPQGSYVYDKKKEYIKKSNRGLNRLAGVTLDNFPKEVEDQINEKYNYNMNSYITDRMGKVKKFNPKRRDEWIDELGPRSREVVANSKYGSKLQPSLWSRSLAGLATLASPFSPDIEAEVKASSLPGLTRKETNEIYNANYKGIPLGGLETFSAADIPGAVVANYLKNSKKDNPNIFSGELMSNVDAVDAMAMNPIGVVGGIEGLATLGTKGVSLLGLTADALKPGAKALSKFVGTESGVLPSFPNATTVAEPLIFSKPQVGKITNNPWQMQEFPGLHFKSTMSDGAVSKIIEPKTGLINVDQALGIIAKESNGSEKVNLIKNALGNQIPKKMDFNDFRKLVQDEIIPLDTQVAEVTSGYGLENIKYPKSIELNEALSFNRQQIFDLEKEKAKVLSGNNTVDMGSKELKVDQIYTGIDTMGNRQYFDTLDEAKEFEKTTLDYLNRSLENYNKNIENIYVQLDNAPLENKTLIISNQNKFGIGSDAHSNPAETLGHIHYLIDKETPDIITGTQIQADAFQGPYRVMPNVLNEKEELKKIADLEDAFKKQEDIIKGAKKIDEFTWLLADGTSYISNSRYQYVINNLKKEIDLHKAHLENFSQKSLLDKSHQERYIQELVAYAAKRGDINKVRLPTKETAVKVQSYIPNGIDYLGPETQKLLNQDLSFDEIMQIKQKEGAPNVDYSLENPEVQIFKDMYDQWKKNEPIEVYHPRHKTILKKYSDMPKVVKKLYGVDTKLVKDSKGNSWYEFDIPKSFKEGKGEIKAYKKGGIINDPFNSSMDKLSKFTQ